MPTLKSLIKQKNIRLEQVPSALLTEVEKLQKKMFADLISILDDIDKQGGFLVASADNLKKLSSLTDDIKSDLFGSEYSDVVEAFVNEYDVQKTINNEILKKEFEAFEKSSLADEVFEKSKSDAIDALLGSPLDTEFLKPLDKLLNDSISTGASWKDTVSNIQEFVMGSEEKDGKILQYSKGIAHDAFSTADRSYTNAVADEIEAEWFKWSGAVIPTSRCVCIKWHEQFFHYKELEAFGRGENLGDCKSGDLWDGANAATNEKTIFIYAGGHGCNHAVLPVSVFSVPKEVIDRNLANGNYTPSEKELELVNG